MNEIIHESQRVAERATNLLELSSQMFDTSNGCILQVPVESFQSVLDRNTAVADAFMLSPKFSRKNYKESTVVRCAFRMIGIDPAWFEKSRAQWDMAPLACMSSDLINSDAFRIALHTFRSFMPMTNELRELIETAEVECGALLEIADEDDADDMRDLQLCKAVESIAQCVENDSFTQRIDAHLAQWDKKNEDSEEDELVYHPL